jgi:hypothetical protein
MPVIGTTAGWDDDDFDDEIEIIEIGDPPSRTFTSHDVIEITLEDAENPPFEWRWPNES